MSLSETQHRAAYINGNGNANLYALPYVDIIRLLHLFNRVEFARVHNKAAQARHFKAFESLAECHKEADTSRAHAWRRMYTANHFLSSDKAAITGMCLCAGDTDDRFLFVDYHRRDPDFPADEHRQHSSMLIYNPLLPPLSGTHFFLCGQNIYNGRTGALDFHFQEIMYRQANGRIKHLGGEGITRDIALAGLCYAIGALENIRDGNPVEFAENALWFERKPEIVANYVHNRIIAPYDNIPRNTYATGPVI